MAESSKQMRSLSHKFPIGLTPGKTLLKFADVETPTSQDERNIIYLVLRKNPPQTIRAKILVAIPDSILFRAANDPQIGNATFELTANQFVSAKPLVEVTVDGLPDIADMINSAAGISKGFSRKKRNKKRRNKGTKRYRR